MMSTQHGSHIWYELLTGDVDGASAFYRKVLPWTVEPAGMPDIDYRIATAADGGQVAGIMALTPQMGERGPGWMGYIGVDDVDAAAARIAAAGGAVRDGGRSARHRLLHHAWCLGRDEHGLCL